MTSSLSPIFFICLDFSSRNVVRFPTLNRLIEFKFSENEAIHVLLLRYSQRFFCVIVAIICTCIISLSTPSSISPRYTVHENYYRSEYENVNWSFSLWFLFDLSSIRVFLFMSSHLAISTADCLHNLLLSILWRSDILYNSNLFSFLVRRFTTIRYPENI